MSVNIHPTAVVSPKAELGEGVSIGPYAVIEDQVTIGRGTTIGAQSMVLRWTALGENNQVSPSVILGGPPQDIGYRGEETHLVIGDNNILREFITIHRGTVKGGGLTRIGSQNMLMNYCHIGHDCRVGDNVIMANGVNLAGHVEVGHSVVFGGGVFALQFCRVGDFAFIGGMSGLNRDVPPFTICEERRQVLRGLNLVGLKRNGFDAARIKSIKEAYKILFMSKKDTFAKRLAGLSRSELAQVPDVAHLISFIKSSSKGVAH